MSAVAWAQVVSTVISTSGSILIALINKKMVRRNRPRTVNHGTGSGQVDSLSPRRQISRPYPLDATTGVCDVGPTSACS